MGSFVGHVVPGTFLIIAGLWWTVQIYKRYFQSLTKSGPPYLSTPTWKVRCGRCGICDVEAKFVLAASAIGIIIEVAISPSFHGTSLGANNAQHATMYFFFGLVGLASIVLPKLRVFPNHEDIIYCIMFLAFIVEGGLFQFHLYGRPDLDVILHILLYYTIYADALCVLAEMRFRSNPMLALGRAFFTLVQGTWFWHGGWVLYNPVSNPWHGVIEGEDAATHGGEMGMDHGGHNAIMMAVMAFAWHLAINLLLMLSIGTVVGCIYKRSGDLDQNKIMMQSVNHPSKGYTVISLNEDEGEGD